MNSYKIKDCWRLWLSNRKHEKRNHNVSPDSKSSLTLCDTAKTLSTDEQVEDEVDGGFGWFVVGGTFIVFFFIAGFVKSMGMLTKDLLDEYEGVVSPSLVTWMPSGMVTSSFIVSPITSMLCNKFDSRTTLVIGCVLIVTGFVTASQVHNFYLLFSSFVFMVGVGFGLSTTPGIYLIAKYFDKNRGKANSIALSGSAFGSFVMPYVINHTKEWLGLRHFYLAFGCLYLNLLISAALFRPFKPSSGSSTNYSSREEDVNESSCCDDDHKERDRVMPLPIFTRIEYSGAKPSSMYRSMKHIRKNENLNTEFQFTSIMKKSNSLPHIMLLQQQQKIGMSNRLRLRGPDWNNSQFSVFEDASLNNSTLINVEGEKTNGRAHESGNDEITQKSTETSQMKGETEATAEIGSREGDDTPRSMKDMITDTRFQLICTCVVLTVVCFPHSLFYIPMHLSQNLGIHDDDQISLVMSVAAVSELLTRIGFGALIDSKVLSVETCHTITMATLSIGVVIIPFVTNIYLASLVICLISGAGGSWFMVIPMLLAETFGSVNLVPAFGLIRFFQAFSNLLGPSMTAYLWQVSPNLSFYYMSLLPAIGCVINFLELIISRNNK